jgi:parallel beta-helix repeat protein
LKKLIFILFLFNNAFANNYYFANSGNDGNTGTQASPYASISKLNTLIFVAGDSVLFKRGNTFYGTINIAQSGTAGNPIVISAYGIGNKPVINAFTALSGWTAVGGGVYQADCASCKLTDNMLVMNGVEQAIGRYPNTGYLTFESASGNTSITDNELTSTPNWTGGEVVIRKNDWIIDRGKITSHSGSTINYTGTSSYNGIAGFGYFIQNDSLALDSMGEWFLSPSGKMKVYFGANTPSNYIIQTSTIDTLIYINGHDYITVDNLSLQGANVAAVMATGTNHVTIQNCDINFSGSNAIMLDGVSSHFTVNGNTINHSNSAAIQTQYLSTQTYSYIGYNAISNSGYIVGMGGNDDGKYIAVQSLGSKAIYENNSVDTTGYLPLEFGGDSSIVRNNAINYFCFVKQDGGGIYTFTSPNGVDSITYIPRIVKNNIVRNGIGAIAGTNSIYVGQVAGIYLDNNTSQVTVSGNTVDSCATNGILLNSAHSVTITNNTLVNNNNGISVVTSTDEPIYKTSITKNIIARKLGVNTLVNTTNIVHVNNTNLSYSFPSTYYTFGTVDSNYYYTPNDSAFLFANRNFFNGASKRIFSDWQTYTSAGSHSTLSTTPTILEYNDGNTNKTISLDSNYIDHNGTTYNGSITLAPYSSAVLINNGAIATVKALKHNGKTLIHNGKILTH